MAIRAVLYLLLASFPGSVAFASTLIDDFSDGSITVERTADTVATAQQTGLDSSSTIGGERSLSVGQFGIAPQTLTVDASLATMTFETGDTPGYFTVGYGSDESPLGIDLLADGSHSFAVDFSTDTNTPRFGLRVRTATGADSVGTGFFAVDVRPLGNGLLRAVIPFELYDAPLDFRQIELIELEAGRFPSTSSITFHRFATIPEPSAVVLGAGLIFVVVCNRRRAPLASRQCDAPVELVLT